MAIDDMNSKLVLALLAGALLAGCAAQPKPLYHWGEYQPRVYEHFRAESAPEEQILRLEEGVQKAAAAGEALPPGYHAHLGLLYGRIGRGEEMKRAFEAEKTQFPESAAFIDRLLDKLD